MDSLSYLDIPSKPPSETCFDHLKDAVYLFGTVRNCNGVDSSAESIVALLLSVLTGFSCQILPVRTYIVWLILGLLLFIRSRLQDK